MKLQIKKNVKRFFSLIGMCLVLGVISLQAATLTVTTTADAGNGSLRQAMLDATTNVEANIVTFNVPTTDPGYNAGDNRFTITLLSPLPDVPLAAMTITNSQPQAVTVRGNNTFRIFTLVNSAVFTVNNLTISNGFSNGLGGGILMRDSSTLNLNRSTVSNNTAADGGGIYVSASGTLNIDSSTISGNSATNNGGGIFNNTSGTINATNNTFHGNSATANGGGVYNTATITFTSNTISNNTAGNGGGIYNNFTATLNNNLVALNTATDGTDLFGRGSGNGIAFTGTYNLIGNADGSTGLAAAPNRAGSTSLPINPMLGPLQNNGGVTFTQALLNGSPAIDKGNSPTIMTDQRGQMRPADNPSVPNDSGNGADIGAIEAPAAPTAGSISISGQVVTPQNFGLSNATVTLTDSDGNSQTFSTQKFGYFQFADVAAGETYIVSVNSKRYTYTAQVISANQDLTGLVFEPIQ